MKAFQIPLSSDNQTFDIHLGAKHYLMSTQWNAEMGLWVLNILDYNTGAALVNGLPLTTGCNLLDQFDYLEIPGSLIVYGPESNEPPTFDSLGNIDNLYYLSFEDIPNA